MRPGPGTGNPRLRRHVRRPRFARWPATANDSIADEAARTYEHELRTKLLAESERARGRWRRHRRTLALAAVLLALAGGAATFLAVRAHRRAGEALIAIDAAKAGLARDTVGALREASRVLASARAVLPDDAAAAALTVEVDGLLARDHGDAAARDRVKELLAGGRGGEGALAGRCSSPIAARSAPRRRRSSTVPAGRRRSRRRWPASCSSRGASTRQPSRCWRRPRAHSRRCCAPSPTSGTSSWREAICRRRWSGTSSCAASSATTPAPRWARPNPAPHRPGPRRRARGAGGRRRQSR